MTWSGEFRNLVEEISNMHGNRIDFINNLKNDIQQMKKESNGKRSQMKADLLAGFNAWDERRRRQAADFRSTAQALLKDLKEGNKARAKDMNELRADTQAFLRKLRKEDIGRFEQESKQRAKDIAQFKADISTMIGGFREERDGASGAWKNLVSDLSRTGKEKKEAKKRRMAGEKSNSGFTRRQEKILSIVKDNPEGITLPEIAYIMGVAFVTITQDVKKLLSNGYIKKRENKYFI